MIAFDTRPSGRCESCWNGPCNNGTLCNGAQRRRFMEYEIGPAHEHVSKAREAIEAMNKAVREAVSPRYQNGAPNSPKPRFRKR